MTDEESPPNWVLDRARCSLDLTFDALVEIVERDVQQMNSLPAKIRNGDQFCIERNGDGLKKQGGFLF